MFSSARQLAKRIANLLAAPPRLHVASRRLGLEVLEDRLTPADIFLVTNTNDSGDGSFRAALGAHLTVSKDPGDAIYFQIDNPIGSLLTINLLSDLPTITIPVFIDARQQMGYSGTPIIRLHDAGTGTRGLEISSGNTTVAGLMITGFDAEGILIHTNGGNKVYQNYLGTDGVNKGDAAGKTLGNNIGVSLSSSSNQIGDAEAGNLISNNSLAGILIDSKDTAAVKANSVRANYIGTSASGQSVLGNGFGIASITGAGQTITGTEISSGNVISGNTSHGISLDGSGIQNTVITGNIIGLTADGFWGLGNAGSGIRLTGGSNNTTIGGKDGVGNKISGNGGDGVTINGSATSPFGNNKILGNFIGTDQLGFFGVGNGGNGIRITNSPNNIIGGSADNVIADNVLAGVLLEGVQSHDNSVQGNLIGVAFDGQVPLGNGTHGVEIRGKAYSNTVGGSSKNGEGNVISANTLDGVFIQDIGTDKNLVRGNIIGLDLLGSTALGNGGRGVAIRLGSENEIGGSTANFQGNVISANAQGGVYVGGKNDDGVATKNLVRGNLIGTNSTNTSAEGLGNGWFGVAVDGAKLTMIGGTNEVYKNIIAASKFQNGGEDLYQGHGVVLFGYADATTISGNWIGVGGAKGNVAMGNNGSGVYVSLRASNTTIGGSSQEAGNYIGSNGTTETKDRGHGYGVNIVGKNTTVDYNWIGYFATGVTTKESENFVGSFLDEGTGTSWGTESNKMV